MIRLFPILVLQLFSSLAFGRANQPKYFYEPSVSIIEGTLLERVFPGPPNYENVKKGDKAEGAWLLSLTRPITVFYDEKERDPVSFNETETEVRIVQLATGETKHFKILKASLGRKISCTGTLFHRFTGHHHTRVLMYLDSCKHLRDNERDRGIAVSSRRK